MNDLATFEVLERGPVVRAALSGEIDLSNASDLQGAIVDVVPNQASGMVLDLSGLSYLDSAGIKMLLTLVGRFGWRGQRLALISPAGSRVRRVIELAGAGDAFVLDETEDTAVAHVADAPSSG